MNNFEIAKQYAENIIQNKIASCQYVRQAAARFISDLENPAYYYNSGSVDTVISFINQLDLTEQKTPKKFILEPWQTYIIANLYGLYVVETNIKKFRSAYIELARKNGKSQLITALAVYHLIFDTDSEIVLNTNSREQLKNVDFKKIKSFCSQLDPKGKHLKQFFNKVTFSNNNIICTASDSSRLDGLNASFVLIDELHEAKNSNVYNVLKSSQGSRLEPMFIIITTSGFDVTSFCFQLRNYCTEILDGSKVDESQFCLIYTLDSEDDFTNKKNWIKANPNLNISIYPNFLEAEVNKAVNNNSEKAGVLVKNFNQWLTSNEILWIDEKYFKQSLQNISMNDPMFKDSQCYVGVDLSSVSDITAVSYMFIVEDIFYFFNHYYLPEDSKNTNINKQLFLQAEQHNEIKITSGNVCDYDNILKDILDVNNINPIIKISYDKWNSTQFAINATNEGLNLSPYSQTAGNLNKPVKEFERLIKSDKIVIQKNSLTYWMLNNVVIKINQMGNYSIDKSSKNKKIDSVAAMLNCLGCYLENPTQGFNIY